MPSDSRSAEGPSWRDDLRAASSVALLALPLSLGISAASGFPPLSGVITVVVGGLVTLFVGGRSFLIKGPAAGLITIMLGAVTELEQVTGRGLEATLAAVCAAGAIQVLVSRLDVSKWVARVPRSVIVGMLLAIGISILRTQIPVVAGTSWSELPRVVRPGDAIVGATVLAVVVGWTLAVPARWRRAPPAVVGVAVGVALSIAVAGSFPVDALEIGAEPFAGLPRPDFSLLLHPVTLRWTFALAAVGTIESALTTQVARDLSDDPTRIEPERDLLWVGIGNVVAPLFGGIPMISEVVRSTANFEQRARGPLSGTAHAVLVLGTVLLIPAALRWLPVSALAALIVAAGIQLMSPRRWWALRHRPLDVTAIAVTAVLGASVDLLVGVGAGLACHLGLGAWASARARQSPQPLDD